MEFLADLWAALREHWAKVLLSLAGVAVGTLWGRWRARRQWERHEFLHRLNVSLTSIDGGWLRIRTLLEKDMQDVLLNRTAVRTVSAAAQRTTEQDALVPLPEADAWFVLNAVLNEVSERFANGLLRRDMGLPVTTARYLLCLTFEVAGSVRTRKVRAMLVRKDLLESLPPEMPRLESPNHETRWLTLQQMARAWKSRPHLFQEVELLS